jgi:hypothetical protein
MKAIKIILSVIVVGAISFFVWKSLVKIGGVDEVTPPKNQFIERIEREIDLLRERSDSEFCGEFHEEVGYHIEDGYKDGRFGESQLENDQWKDILSKRLYTAYADKFINQAFYVFRGSDWEIESLEFIRSEYRTLRQSKLLEKGSSVDKKLTEIQTICNKYDEIVDFISASKRFSYLASGLSERFPISTVEKKIALAKDYLKQKLNNEYLNHCTRLHSGLREIPQALFRAHVRYLDNKITQWSGRYSSYNSQSDYANNLYQPLKSEIDLLDNGTYNAANFNAEYNRLTDKLNADSQKAYSHFSNKQ